MLQEKCAYFTKCGGCIWQDLSLKEYIKKKESFILHAFKDVGLTIQLEPTILIPTGTRRRASFAFNGKYLGFNEAKSHKIIEINACPLLTKNINTALPLLRHTISKLKSVGNLFVLDTTLGLDIHIKDKKGCPKLEQLELLNTLNDIPTIARIIYNETPIFEKAPLPDSADSFMQPSLEGEQTLIQLVIENIANTKNAIDLFCGKGTFTTPLLNKGIKTKGYDNSLAVKSLNENGEQRDLFRNPLTPDEFKNIDLVILDPARSGALTQVEQLAQTQVPKIIMISCNPKTAARDIKILIENGWQLNKTTAVDQFTYSNHIELVSILTKE